jgi:hypothetical protein
MPNPALGKDHGPTSPPVPLPVPTPEEIASEDEAFYHEHLLEIFYHEHLLEIAQENQTQVIPVKAFLLCTR